jgi:octaprenyl-diphosphate synthase
MTISATRTEYSIASSADFLEPIEAELKLVEEILSRELCSSVQTVSALTNHMLEAGGKRLRPSLVLLSARACAKDYDVEKVVSLAAVTEMVHTATLIHDDVIDDADSRRGRPTANSKWGNQISVLSGDYVVARAFSLMAQYSQTALIEVLAKATVSMAEGEISQLEMKGDASASTEHYLSVIQDKTAAFISACCQSGALLVGGEAVRESLAQYGLNLGTAFQITDDLLDLVGNPKVTGKPIGGDVREGKVTLPLILAMQRATPSDREAIERIVSSAGATSEDLDFVRRVTIDTGAIELTRNAASEFVSQAVNCLSALPPGEAVNCLKHLAYHVLDRQK